MSYANTQKIEVSIDFVIDALETRYNHVKDQWGGDAAHALWDKALDLVKEGGFSGDSASLFVDNYLINGEFISRESFYVTDCESYGIELEDTQQAINGCVELTSDQWEMVQQEALLSDKGQFKMSLSVIEMLDMIKQEILDDQVSYLLIGNDQKILKGALNIKWYLMQHFVSYIVKVN